APGCSDQIIAIMVCGRRQRGRGEYFGRYLELRHETLVQAAFDDDCVVRGMSELNNFIRRVSLGGSNSQCATEGDQIVRILDHVMTKTFFTQGAGSQFTIERHGASGFEQGGILLPDISGDRKSVV